MIKWCSQNDIIFRDVKVINEAEAQGVLGIDSYSFL